MSMKENACSGYVVELNKLNHLIPDEYLEEYENFMDSIELEKLDELLGKVLQLNVNCFQLNDDDNSDDLEVGTIYIRFDESDLYEKIEKPVLKELKDKGVKPQEANWAIWS